MNKICSIKNLCTYHFQVMMLWSDLSDARGMMWMLCRSLNVLSWVSTQRRRRKRSDYGYCVLRYCERQILCDTNKASELSPLKNEIYLDALIKKVKPDYVLKKTTLNCELLKALQIGYNMVWVNQNVSKRNNLFEVSPRVERWDVLFRQEGDEELFHQITNFPNVQHDDIMDAFTMFVLYWSKVTNNDLYII